MKINKTIFFLLFGSLLFNLNSFAQDSISVKHSSYNNKLNVRAFILPTACIGYGIIALKSPDLQGINNDIKNQVTPNYLNNKIHIDNYLQFSPAALALALNASGIKGKHNLKNAATIYALSNVILNAIVVPTKHISQEMRPDNSANSSFPSGHTSEAFASAEFLRMEYKDVSPWFGVGGYLAAATTGYLRMYNNKHWFSDVIAGAGVGIASTKIAYWMFSKLQPVFSGSKHKSDHVLLFPTLQINRPGIFLSYSIK